MRLPVQLPPGVKRAGTPYLSQGRWYEANLMRWFEGSMRPVGGWEPVSHDSESQGTGPISVEGIPRGLLIWRTNDGTVYLAIATTSNIYAYHNGLLNDITAIGTVSTPPPENTNVYGDPVVYGSPDTYGGTPPDAPAPPSGPLVADDESLWSLDTFGQFLVGVFAPADGRLRVWELEGNMEEAAPGGESVDGAPTDNRAVVVTPERFVFLLGAGGDSRRIVWPDQERISGLRTDDTSVWSPGGTAGEFTLTTSGRLLAGLRTPRETLLWTDVDLWSAIYVGSDILYSFEKRGSSCGLISPNSFAGVGDGAIWMSDSGFYSYFGSTVPIPCEVHEHVFSELNRQHKKNVVCFHNSQFGEVTWFYPALSATNPNRYVTYNYREQHWTLGQMERTACTDRGGYEYPIMADVDGNVYEHEKGHDRNGLLAFAASGPLELPPGNQVFMIREIIPDNHPNTVLVASLITSLDPLDGEVANGPFDLAYNTPVRLTARQVRLMLHEQTSGEDWRLGQFRLEIEPAGER